MTRFERGVRVLTPDGMGTVDGYGSASNQGRVHPPSPDYSKVWVWLDEPRDLGDERMKLYPYRVDEVEET